MCVYCERSKNRFNVCRARLKCLHMFCGGRRSEGILLCLYCCFLAPDVAVSAVNATRPRVRLAFYVSQFIAALEHAIVRVYVEHYEH